MLHVPITQHKATWCGRNFEPILGQTYWGVCYSQNVLIYTQDSLTQVAITTLLIIFPNQLCTGGKHQTLQSNPVHSGLVGSWLVLGAVSGF